MNTSSKLASFVLIGAACGPPGLSGESSTSDSSTSQSSSESSSESSTSTSTSDSDTSGPDPTSEEGLTFVPMFDEPGHDHCDPFVQDCPDGEKCVAFGSTGGNWDAHKCVPVLGDQAIGEPCTYGGTFEATDDCDENGACWDVMDVNGEPLGICTPFCTGTADDPECPPGLSCLITGNFSFALCVGTCDPLLQDCAADLACYWANNGFNCVFTSENLPAGEPCTHLDDCAEGNPCAIAEVLPSCAGESCCSQWCEIGNEQPCEVLPGTACVPFFEEGMAPPGYEYVGICILPN